MEHYRSTRDLVLATWFSRVNYYKHFFGNYDKHTKSLSILEHGVYRLLIDFYHKSRKPLPSNFEDLAGEIGARTTAERTAIHKVLKKYFTLKNDEYHNDRCDEDIAEYYERASRNAENGKKGGKPKASGLRVGFQNKPTGFETLTQSEASGLEVGFQNKPSPFPIHQTPSTKGEGEGEAPTIQATLPKQKKGFVAPTAEEATREFLRKFEAQFPNPRDPIAMRAMAASWAEDFLNYYGKIGWKVGRNTMQDWHKAIAGWFKRDIDDGKHLKLHRIHHGSTNGDITSDDLKRALSVGRRS